MKRLAIPIAILVFGVVLLGGCFDPPATTDRIYIYPETTKATLDIPFYVYINSECITPIRGFETTISYNPDQVYVQEISWGLFFPKENSFFSEPVIDNINGTISKVFAITIAMELVNRAGTILNIKCIAKNEGTSSIELMNTKVVNSTGLVIFNVKNGIIVSSNPYMVCD